MRLRFPRSCLALLLGGFLLLGCKQGEGETCQIDDDCEDGLTCVNEAGGSFCREPGASADAAPIDAEVPDAGVPDAGAPDAP